MNDPRTEPIVIVRLWQFPLVSCRCRKRVQARFAFEEMTRKPASQVPGNPTEDSDATDGQTLD